eukprot:gene10171-2591_t
MQVESSLINKNVLPGDILGKSVPLEQATTIRIGNGISQTENNLFSTISGTFRSVDSNFFFIENSQKRYIPKVDDFVIGVIVESSVDFYKIDLGSSSSAILSGLGFDGASKRNKPNLKQKDLVYCRVIESNRDLEPEVTCFSIKSKKDWVTGESQFGELKEGYLIQCSIGLCKKLLDPNCYILSYLGEKISFECAIGINGRVWVKDGGEQELNTAAQAVLQVIPEAKIISKGSDSYPITVEIEYEGKIIWSGSQRHLFRKYAKWRQESVKSITEAVKSLQL